jgi:hypothetical protein
LQDKKNNLFEFKKTISDKKITQYLWVFDDKIRNNITTTLGLLTIYPRVNMKRINFPINKKRLQFSIKFMEKTMLNAHTNRESVTI